MGLDKREEKEIPNDKKNNDGNIYSVSLMAAEIILKKIGNEPWNGRMLLKSDAFLKDGKYQKAILDRMEFFTPKEQLADTMEKLESMFQESEESEKPVRPVAAPETENFRIVFCKKVRGGKITKIFLEIQKTPYRFPFELHLISFPDHEIFPKINTGVMPKTGEEFTYAMFPPEEYLTLAFYEIIKELELIKDMSWYHEAYEILCREPVNGRKFWESLNHLIKEYPIPSLEKRMDTFKGYRDYAYMKKRWKSHCKRKKETYPQWEEVLLRLATFLEPVFEGVVKDEVFLGDWMPQLGRYLD